MPNKTIAHSATGIVGVQGPYERLRTRARKTCVSHSVEFYFQATWQSDGKKHKAQFSIAEHGYDGALKLAIKARKDGLKIVEPPR